MSQFDYGFSLRGKVALVTGGATGIGYEIAKSYLIKGAKVGLLDLNDMVHDTAKKLSSFGEVVPLQVDVTNSKILSERVRELANKFGKIDILVNAAGIVILEDAENLLETAWDKTIEVNLKSVFMLSQMVGQRMLQQKSGRIINIASQAGIVAIEKHAAYCVSKAGVISLSQVLALEWSPSNITVNSISPTVVLTELGKKAWAGEVGENLKKQIPARRFAKPEEIAAAAVYLASDEAAMITGANLVVDGGFTIQ
ncbi:GolD/DthD family dehydrogenase [Marinomonas gallaica]|uniref:GolD/DthD family dehydrogenase n=1 Tax=Marinomonas gallaica TaxID=1806667 RepID=UPI003A8E6A83